jgi:hypothetical protein
MEEAMVTRKSASKRPAAKAARPAASSETKPATAPKRAAKAAPAMPRTAAPTPAVAAPAPSPATGAPATAAPTGEARYRWIAHAAYLRAERRGFAPGKEVDDWLAAEAEFLAVYGVR